MEKREAALILINYHEKTIFDKMCRIVEAKRIAHDNGCIGLDTKDYLEWAKEQLEESEK